MTRLRSRRDAVHETSAPARRSFHATASRACPRLLPPVPLSVHRSDVIRVSTPFPRLALCLTLPLLSASHAFAEPIIVVPSGNSGALQSAIGSIPDGGIIELEAGTYVAPSGGFDINSVDKSFTIRSEASGQATLSGSSVRTILRLINASPDPDDSIVFERLVFADGRSTSNGVAGAVTMTRARATFVDCTFRDNVSDAPSTGGGGLFLFAASTVHIVGGLFEDNTATNEGGAIRVAEDSEATIHDVRFLRNRVNLPGHRVSAAGGAVHVTNARVWISESRFISNEGVIGGAVFVFGVWDNPNITTATITNSTFIGNRTSPDPGMNPPPPDTGGAVHSEDDATVIVHGSRFENNTADNKGGAMSQYRSTVEIYDSTFRGNWAPTSGGTISAGSDDANDASTNNGANNRPSVRLTIEDSLIEGDPTGQDPASINGGCIFVNGDTNRSYGLAGVSQMGGATVNRAVVDIRDSVFRYCRAEAPAGNDNDGKGGALHLTHVDLDLLGTQIVDSEAIGSFGQAGGARILIESDARIIDTTFAGNRASFNAAGAVVSGSELFMDGCQFFDNVNLSGNVGAALLSGPNVNLFGSVNLDMDGIVQNTVFSDHATVPLRENDRAAGPINGLQYNANEFFPSTGDVYSNALVGGRTVSGLNSLTVTRNGGVGNTNKSPQGNNVGLGSRPDLASLVAAPSRIYDTAPPGDPAPPTDAFLAYAWSGSSAQLDGQTLVTPTGLVSAGDGVHTLSVGGTDALATILDATIPDATLTASPIAISSGQSSTLTWSTDGTLLEITIDRGVSIPTQASGSIVVTPDATTEYRLIVTTEEGCSTATAKVFVDEPAGDLVFQDGFESGDDTAWSATVN